MIGWRGRISNLQSPDPESGALPLGHSPAVPRHRIRAAPGPVPDTGPLPERPVGRHHVPGTVVPGASRRPAPPRSESGRQAAAASRSSSAASSRAPTRTPAPAPRGTAARDPTPRASSRSRPRTCSRSRSRTPSGRRRRSPAGTVRRARARRPAATRGSPPALPTPVSACRPPAPASACETCDGTPAEASAAGSSRVIEVANSVPVIARPTEPPTCWKNDRLLVAAPIWRTGTLFWTTSGKTEKTGPVCPSRPRASRPTGSARSPRSTSARAC